MYDKDFRMHYTDYLDNMIGDLDDLLVILAQATDKDLQELKVELEKIRQDLADIRDELVKIIDEFPGNIEAVQDAVREAIEKNLEDLYNKVKDYYDNLDGLVINELKEIIAALGDAAYQFKKFSDDQLKEIINEIANLEALVKTKIGEISDNVVPYIEKAEKLAEEVVKKAVEQIKGTLEVLEKAINDPKGFTEEQIKALVEALGRLQEFIDLKIEDTNGRIKALIAQIDDEIENVVIPALQKMIDDLKTEYQNVKDFTKEQLIDLMDKAKMLQELIASEIAWEHEQIRDLVAEAQQWLEEVAAPALEAFIDELKAESKVVKEYTMEEIQKIIDKAELLQAFIESKIAEDSVRLQELIAEAKEWLEKVAAPALEEINAVLREKAQAIKDLSEAEIEEIMIRAQELEMFIACKIAQESEQLKELIVVGKKWAEKAVAKTMDQIMDVGQAIKDKIKKAVIITQEDVKEYFEKLRELKQVMKEYIDVIRKFDPRKEIKELIEKAEKLYDETVEKMREKALEYGMKLIDDLQSGKFDWLLKPTLGITGAELVDYIVDAVAYAFGVMNGEGYLDLQDQLAAALAELDATLELLEEAEAELDPKNPDGKVYALVSEISNLTNQLQQISTENEQLKKQVEELVKKDETEAKVIQKFINGYNVTKTKPTLKKVKNVKGKKVKVTFKGLKKVDTSKYKVNYKTGKKAKNKKVNKKTSGAKTLKCTLKKLKKGKKYYVQVIPYTNVKNRVTGVKTTIDGQKSNVKKL
jgi:ABC-type transporter Mla subunit MlaD